jgi:hypothetical protein
MAPTPKSDRLLIERIDRIGHERLRALGITVDTQPNGDVVFSIPSFARFFEEPYTPLRQLREARYAGAVKRQWRRQR